MMSQIKFIVSLAIVLSVTFIVQPTLAAENDRPDIEALRLRFEDPPASAGTTPFWSIGPVTQTKETIRTRIRSAHENGYGGLTPIHSSKGFLTDAYIEMYGYVLDTAKELGMKIVFYDEAGFPTGKAGGLFAKKYPDDLVKYLARGVAVVEGPGIATISMPKGKIMSVVVKNMMPRGEQRVVTAEAHWSDDGSTVQWEAPQGQWEVQAFVCATAPKRMLADWMSPEVSKKFLEMVYDPFYKRFPEHFGTTIKMTFFDDLSVYQGPYDLLWTPSFNATFEKHYGRSPEALYPALWEDIGPETEAARASLYNMRNELFAAGFPKTVQAWCAERGIIGTGHPANAYRPNPIESLGDTILFYKYAGTPGIDYIQFLGNGVDLFKVPSSAAYNFDRNLVAIEIYGVFKFLPRDPNMLYRGAMQVYTRGINYLIPNGKGLSPHPPSSGSFGTGLPAFNRWAARCETLLQTGRHVADIGVLYPIDDMEARFSVSSPRNGGKDPIPGTDYHIISNLLTAEMKHDFTFLHPETINERCSVDDVEFVLNNTNNWERYKVIILPACRTIRAENLIKVRDFMRHGGHVIATTCLPEKSTEFGRDTEVRAMTEEMFGTGGKGIFLPLPDKTTLRTALDGLGITWDVRMDNATEIPSMKVDRGQSPEGGEFIFGNREFSYIHKSLADSEVYFFGNSSETDVSADVTLRGKMALESWDPQTGASQPLNGTPVEENGESVTRFKLQLPAIHGVFVVGRKTIHMAERIKPL